ncbi:MAG: hypothetical protein QOI21_601 [Actinomycetota bacterium]|nr:hypothetical protein [Actinomycetota bacterium]
MAFVIPTFAPVVVVAQELEAWEHATLQRGVDVYLEEQGTEPELGAVDFATASIGPEEVT